MLLFIFPYAITVLCEAVGKTIKTLRKQKGISQEKLADEINSHQVYISEIERGLKLPSLIVLDEMAKCFGITLTELISIVEQNNKKQEQSSSMTK